MPSPAAKGAGDRTCSTQAANVGSGLSGTRFVANLSSSRSTIEQRELFGVTMALYAIEAVRWDANGTVSKLRWSPHWIDGSVPEYGARAEVDVEEALAAMEHGARAQPLLDGQFGPAVRPAQRLDGSATITDDEQAMAGRDLASLPTF